MAEELEKYLGRDPFTYSQERERFQKDLYQFHRDRGTPFNGLPTVTGEPVDLYLLYTLTVKYGGFHQVCDKRLWSKISPELFNFPSACANSELALKQLYMRYLYLYERVFIHGDDPDHPDDEDSGPRGSKNSRILVHQVPTRYNYRQHNVDGRLRANTGLSMNLAMPNRYERLEKSLLSGLPNEVDFAMNICCVLSTESNNSLKLLKRRQLIDLLLAHIGLFTDSSDLAELYHYEWYPKTKRNFTKFWYETIEYDDLEYSSALVDMISHPSHRKEDQDFYLHQKKSLSGSEVLHLSRDTETNKDSMLKRIQQVSNILRNLSFDAPNSRALAESPVLFNFVMLCCHNTMPELRRNGLDTLSNIAKRYVIPAVQESRTQLIIRCLHRWIYSEDKLELVNALQVLTGLSQVEQNEESLLECLSADIFTQIVSLARIYDLQLIIASLDTLYYLSELGEGMCEAISLVKHSIDFLTDLITVETSSFGESAVRGIAVKDFGLQAAPQARAAPGQPAGHPGGSQRELMGPPAPPFSALDSRQAPVRPHMIPPHHQRPGMIPGTPAGIRMPGHSSAPPPPPGYKNVLPKPMPGVGGPMRTARPPPLKAATPQNLSKMNPETVACNWLRANYEQYPSATVPTAKVHQEYSVWLQRRGGDAVCPVPAAPFVQCVKKVFPHSDLTIPGPESQLRGIRWKPPMSQPPHNQSPMMHQSQPRLAPGQSNLNAPPPYNSSHMIPSHMPNMLQPQGSPMLNSLPPRISSPPSNHSNSDMLRSMLLSNPHPSTIPPPSSHQRQRSDSGNSNTSRRSSGGRGASRSRSSRGARSASPKGNRRASSTESPLPPLSPASGSLELQICGSAEKAENLVNGASLAKIHRVENPRSPITTTTPSKNTTNPTQADNKTDPESASDKPQADLSITPVPLKENGDDIPTADSKLESDLPADVTAETSSLSHKKKRVDDDVDSAMDTNEAPPSHDSDKTNGTSADNQSVNSPAPLCNGNHSDADSLLAEPSDTKQKGNKTEKVSINGTVEEGGGDSDTKPCPPLRNGFINGLEKMIENIEHDEKPEKVITNHSKPVTKSINTPITEHQRHHSGESIASQSSTSTNLSVSQHSLTGNKPSDQPNNHSKAPDTGKLSANRSDSSSATASPLPNIVIPSGPLPDLSKPLPIQTIPVGNVVNSSANPLDAAQIKNVHNIPTLFDKNRMITVNPLAGVPIAVNTALLPDTTRGGGVISPAGTAMRSPGSSSPGASAPRGRRKSSSSSTRGTKRPRSSSSTDSQRKSPVTPDVGQYRCMWEGCLSLGYTTAGLLRKHVTTSHMQAAGKCLWSGCDGVERKRWALVSHVNERHTSDSVLAKVLALREKGLPPPQYQHPQQPYNPHAAKFAILRHFPKPPYPDFMDEREGPVTKHIRFTAALILRNLCRYSQTGRTLLKKHETLLSTVAGSNMEASAAAINCLWEIQQLGHS